MWEFSCPTISVPLACVGDDESWRQSGLDRTSFHLACYKKEKRETMKV